MKIFSKKGEYKITVNGNQSGLRFGMWGRKMAVLSSGMDEKEYWESFSDNFKAEMALVHIFYGAAIHFHENQGTEIQYKLVHMANWIEDNETLVNEIVKEQIAFEEKNVIAPAAGR